MNTPSHSFLWQCILLLGCTCLALSCSKNDETDPYDINYIYFRPPINTSHAVEYTGAGNFLTKTDSIIIISPVKSTKPAPEDITVELGIDQTLIDTYNKLHNTNYTLLKNIELQNATLHIPKGQYISADTLKVRYTNMDEFKSGAQQLILPVAIKSVSSSHVSISQTAKAVFTYTATLRTNYINLIPNYHLNLIYENNAFNNLQNTIELTNILSSSLPVDAELQVKLQISPQLIEEYNNKHQTNYIPLPGATLKDTDITLANGSRTSGNSIAITIDNASSQITPGKNYLIPITISKINGIGAQAGNDTTCYIAINTVEKINVAGAQTPTGTLITNLDNCQVTVNGSSTGTQTKANWTELITQPGIGDLKDFDYIKANEPLEIDLGRTEENITSIRIRYWRGRAFYSARNTTTIEMRDENNNKIGECEVQSASEHIFTLAKPTNARYIRITYSRPSYTIRGVSISGIYIYKSDN